MGLAVELVGNDYWWQTTHFSTVLLALLPVWLLGACIGLLVIAIMIMHAQVDSQTSTGMHADMVYCMRTASSSTMA